MMYTGDCAGHGLGTESPIICHFAQRRTQSLLQVLMKSKTDCSTEIFPAKWYRIRCNVMLGVRRFDSLGAVLSLHTQDCMIKNSPETRTVAHNAEAHLILGSLDNTPDRGISLLSQVHDGGWAVCISVVSICHSDKNILEFWLRISETHWFRLVQMLKPRPIHLLYCLYSK